MKWSDLSTEERDILIAEKVMGWQAKPCDYEIGEQPTSPDGWYCLKCGYSDYWGIGYAHEEMPPHYSTDMNAALLIVTHERFSHVYLNYVQPSKLFSCALYSVNALGERQIDKELNILLPEAICIAALKAVGVEIEP